MERRPLLECMVRFADEMDSIGMLDVADIVIPHRKIVLENQKRAAITATLRLSNGDVSRQEESKRRYQRPRNLDRSGT